MLVKIVPSLWLGDDAELTRAVDKYHVSHIIRYVTLDMNSTYSKTLY